MFELPSRHKKCIEMKHDYSLAVRYIIVSVTLQFKIDENQYRALLRELIAIQFIGILKRHGSLYSEKLSIGLMSMGS